MKGSEVENDGDTLPVYHSDTRTQKAKQLTNAAPSTIAHDGGQEQEERLPEYAVKGDVRKKAVLRDSGDENLPEYHGHPSLKKEQSVDSIKPRREEHLPSYDSETAFSPLARSDVEDIPPYCESPEGKKDVSNVRSDRKLVRTTPPSKGDSREATNFSNDSKPAPSKRSARPQQSSTAIRPATEETSTFRRKPQVAKPPRDPEREETRSKLDKTETEKADGSERLRRARNNSHSSNEDEIEIAVRPTGEESKKRIASSVDHRQGKTSTPQQQSKLGKGITPQRSDLQTRKVNGWMERSSQKGVDSGEHVRRRKDIDPMKAQGRDRADSSPNEEEVVERTETKIKLAARSERNQRTAQVPPSTSREVPRSNLSFEPAKNRDQTRKTPVSVRNTLTREADIPPNHSVSRGTAHQHPSTDRTTNSNGSSSRGKRPVRRPTSPRRKTRDADLSLVGQSYKADSPRIVPLPRRRKPKTEEAKPVGRTLEKSLEDIDKEMEVAIDERETRINLAESRLKKFQEDLESKRERDQQKLEADKELLRVALQKRKVCPLDKMRSSLIVENI